MHRRELDRGRWIIAVSAIVLIVACFLQWWQIGGAEGELSEHSERALNTPFGLLMFLAAVAALLVIALPYAAETPVGIDRPFTYLICLIVMFGAYVWYFSQILLQGLIPYPPARGPGLWVGAVAIVLFARGVYETFEARWNRF